MNIIAMTAGKLLKKWSDFPRRIWCLPAQIAIVKIQEK